MKLYCLPSNPGEDATISWAVVVVSVTNIVASFEDALVVSAPALLVSSVVLARGIKYCTSTYTSSAVFKHFC